MRIPGGPQGVRLAGALLFLMLALLAFTWWGRGGIR